MKLIVIEGACDGIGKTTQFNMLYDRLQKEGNNVVSHHFPSYNTEQGKGVENYLAGSYGKINELSPYFINMLYAYDRALTWKKELKNSLNSEDIVLLDRYTTSSIIYQAAAIEDEQKRKEFVDFVINYEYNLLQIPKPDSVIFLTAPYDLVTYMRQERVANEGIQNDIHERDNEFMRKVYENANELASYLNWEIIECSKDGHMRSIEDIHEDIYQRVKQKVE